MNRDIPVYKWSRFFLRAGQPVVVQEVVADLKTQNFGLAGRIRDSITHCTKQFHAHILWREVRGTGATDTRLFSEAQQNFHRIWSKKDCIFVIQNLHYEGRKGLLNIGNSTHVVSCWITKIRYLKFTLEINLLRVNSLRVVHLHRSWRR